MPATLESIRTLFLAKGWQGQPRVPKGSPAGGEWAAAGAATKPAGGKKIARMETLGAGGKLDRPLAETFGSAPAAQAFGKRLLEHLPDGEYSLSVGLDYVYARKPGERLGQEVAGVHIEAKTVGTDYSTTAQISRVIYRNPLTGELEAKHDLYRVPQTEQGKGRAAAMMRDLIPEYERLGVTRIHTIANIDAGAYAWARLGFVPLDADHWGELGEDLGRKVSTMRERGRVTREQANTIYELLGGPRENIRAIADMRLGEWNIGRDLLSGLSWFGEFDMHDREARRRVGL